MLDHDVIQLALRQRLLTLVVATTGSTSLSATATGYARGTGSFVSDGFARGMEVAASGFGTNGVSVITSVSALNLGVSRLVLTTNAEGAQVVTRPPMVVEGAAAGRSLVAGLPSLRAWENARFDRVTGQPYVEEQYIPGPETMRTDSYAGLLELTPMYSPRIFAPANRGISADGNYADAIRRLFTPGTTMTLATGEQLIVRGDVAAFRGQRAQSDPPGWSVIPITIPLRVTTVSVPA